MQSVSQTYLNIITGDHWFESKLVIDGVGTFDETNLFEVKTSHFMFDNTPTVGKAIAGEIDVTMLYPRTGLPTMACLRPYVRACNATSQSEWIPQGIYYIDTRERTRDTSGLSYLKIHGFDAMLKAEQMFDGGSTITGNTTDTTMVAFIAGKMGVPVDSRTNTIMNKSYTIPLPTGYTYREVLGYIASMYAGCFLITDEGKLRLVAINELPPETSCLIDTLGNWLTFGGDRILV